MKQADILSLLEEAERLGERGERPAGEARSSSRFPTSALRNHDGKFDGDSSSDSAFTESGEVKQDNEPLRESSTKKEDIAGTTVANEAKAPVAPAVARDVDNKHVSKTELQPAPAKQPAVQDSRKPVQPAGASGGDGGDMPKAAYSGSWHDQVPTSHGSIVGKGLLFVFGFLAVFLAWSLLFPISSAVVASGKIISTGQNKLVQHPVGGVVKNIRVAEGTAVQKGDIILVLDNSTTRAELSRLVARKQTLTAQKMRYEMEQTGGNASFPVDANAVQNVIGGEPNIDSENSSTQETQAKAVLEEQRKEFDAGRKRLGAQLSTITFQIETLKEQKIGLNARLLGARKLLELTSRDLGKIRPLANDGYLPKSRLWDIEKTQLEQTTEIGNLTSQIDAIDQRVSESEAKLAELDQADRESRSEELTKVIGELAELSEPIKAARRALELTELKAPVSGTITKLIANTEGGVVPAGEPVAEIVPMDAELLVEFRVPLNKSKYVNTDKKVRVSMATFNRRTYQPIDGKVNYVSADSLVDTQTGEAYFLARAVLTPDPNKNTGIEEVSTGMASEVYVLSAPRVFASYVLQPLIDSFNRAFREI